MRVLLIEDDVDIRDFLAMHLDLEGYQVDPCGHGASALQHLNSSSVLPDVILLDLMMPVMDGWEFRRLQKDSPRLKDIPVIVISADISARSRLAELDIYAFLKKPISMQTLFIYLQELQNTAEQEPQNTAASKAELSGINIGPDKTSAGSSSLPV